MFPLQRAANSSSGKRPATARIHPLRLEDILRSDSKYGMDSVDTAYRSQLNQRDSPSQGHKVHRFNADPN